MSLLPAPFLLPVDWWALGAVLALSVTPMLLLLLEFLPARAGLTTRFTVPVWVSSVRFTTFASLTSAVRAGVVFTSTAVNPSTATRAMAS